MFHVSKAILWPCTKVIFWPVLWGLFWWLPLTPHTPYNILCSPGPCSCHLEPRTTTLADLQWQVKVIPLIYIWYTQRSTTQPINIQGKFNPLNNTKYRIIISSSMSLVNPKRSEIVSWCRKSRSNAVHVLLLINNIHRHVTKVNIHLPAHQKKFKLGILNNLRGVSFPCFHRCMRS